MAECIVLKGGSGADLDVVTAGSPDILAGKVGVDKEGEPLTGTMPNRGAVSQALNAGAGYAIPEGYHNGGGKVTANSLASQTSATATAAQVLSGQTAWVNGSKLTGNMPNYSTTPTPIDAIRINNNRFEVAVAAGYHGYSWASNGYEYMSYGQVANAIGLNPAKLKKGEWLCGVTGTFEGYVPGATDLYSYGNNIANFTKYSATNAIKFDTGQITLLGANPGGGGYVTAFTTDISLVGRSYANILFSIVSASYNESLLFGVVKAGQAGGTSAPSSYLSVATRNFGDGSNITLSVPINALQGMFRVAFSFYDGTAKFTAAIHRIWLS